MINLFKKINLIIILFLFIFNSTLRSEIIEKIDIQGNSRVSSETIKMFTGVSISDDISEYDLNEILKIYIIQIFLI